MSRPSPLGRGLGALLPPPSFAQTRDDYLLCPTARIRPDPNQPRQRFPEEALAELAASVREKGILQPLVVRRDGEDYILIAGERRLRAAAAAGLERVPVVIKDVDPDEVLELALVENLQREDLDPLEEAHAFERLMGRPGMTQQAVASRLGKSRSAVANTLRLLALPGPIQQRVVDGDLSAGHARALLALHSETEQLALAEEATKEGLSVRQLEQAVRRKRGRAPRQGRAGHGGEALAPYCQQIARELGDVIGRPVAVKLRARGGRVEISFDGIEDLRRLRDRLVGLPTTSPEDPGVWED